MKRCQETILEAMIQQNLNKLLSQRRQFSTRISPLKMKFKR